MEHKNCLKKVTAVFSAHEAAPIWKLRHFAVLALLTEIGGELHFILTKRAAGVNQPGDVCFPGGHREQGETLVETALRETEEEIGISQKDIRLLGKSDFMLTIYRGMIQPYIAYIPMRFTKPQSQIPRRLRKFSPSPCVSF